MKFNFIELKSQKKLDFAELLSRSLCVRRLLTATTHWAGESTSTMPSGAPPFSTATCSPGKSVAHA